MEQRRRPVSRRVNPRGTYFERLVSYPSPNGPVNQLERVVERLAGALARGQRQGNAYELGLTVPVDGMESELSADLRVQSPGIDTQLRGFPCLSHISLTLFEGQLHMSALYRNHHFLRRAYGNYLGLGRLLQFLARESGAQTGELLCVSSHADAEVGSSAGFGRGQLVALVDQCRRRAAVAPIVPESAASRDAP
jgi:hypothetical protein